MIITVFRSRLRDESRDDYFEMLKRMRELAASMPGFVSAKTFIADDGERCTIVEFESEEHQKAWARHPEHRLAQVRGRAAFYSAYDLKVATVERTSAMELDGVPTPDT